MDNLYVVALAILAVAVTGNMVMTVAVIRRLRAGVDDPNSYVVPSPVGQRVPQFSAETLQGPTVNDGHLTRETSFIGFFSAACASCRTHLPRFVDYAAGHGEKVAITVVIGDRERCQDLIDSATAATLVVHEEDKGPISTAFGVTMFPTLLRIERDKIAAFTTNVDRWAQPAELA